MPVCDSRSTVTATFSGLFATSVLAAEKICLFNKGAIAIEAGSAEADSSRSVPNDDFRLPADFTDDGPSASGEMRMWVCGARNRH